MARVRLVEKGSASPEVGEMFQRIEDNGARVLNLYKALASSPKVSLNFIRLGSAVMGQMSLAPKLREMTILRVAQLTDCEYQWTQHSTLGREVGVSEGQLNDLSHWEGSSEFSEEERAVLRYVDEVTREVKVTGETFEGLKAFLGEQEIVELTVTAGYYGMAARVLVALEVDMESSVGSASELLGRRAQRK